MIEAIPYQDFNPRPRDIAGNNIRRAIDIMHGSRDDMGRYMHSVGLVNN
jgi:hypothetical protein